MKEIIETIKRKKFLVLALAAFAVLVVVFFIISTAINNKKKAGNPVASPPKEKTMEEIIKDLTAPVKNGETPTPVSQKVIDSLTAPTAAIKPASGAKNNKASKPAPTPTPVSKEIIDSLTAPAGK